MFWIVGLLIWAAKILVGIGLVYGSIRGLITQEDVYDKESSKMMNWSAVFGLLVGVFLLVNAFGYVRLPIPFFGGGLPCGG